MSSTKQIIHTILIGFAFSTTFAAERLVEIHVAHKDSKLVLCHPNSEKVVERKPVALLVHH